MPVARTRQGPLTASVLELCRDLHAGTRSAALHESLAVLKDRLLSPLQVAVGGKVNAGKSTLVNALLGRKVAEVQSLETRRVTTLFLPTSPGEEMVTVHFPEGPRHTPLTSDGTVPKLCEEDEERATRREVYLDCDALAEMTLVDTPGLHSARTHYSELGEAALLGLAGAVFDASGTQQEQEERETVSRMRQADALVFLVGGQLHEADRDMLLHFTAQFGGESKSGFNTLALISHADTFEDADPFSAAEELAGIARHDLGPSVVDVVPVSALLAETARTRAIEESDLTLLRTLAARPDLDPKLERARVFEASADVGTPAARSRLAGLLGSYGLRFCVQELRGTPLTVEALHEALKRRSGIDEVWDLINRDFLRHADVIKAETALVELDLLASRLAKADRESSRSVRERVARTRRQPEFHRVREVDVLRRLTDGTLRVGERRTRDLQLLMLRPELWARLGAPPDVSARTLRARITEMRSDWQRVSGDRLRPLAVRQAARVTLETLRGLEDELNSARGDAE